MATGATYPAATEQEKAYTRPASDRAAVEGRIELSRVSFRYSPDEPFVVKELSATIELPRRFPGITDNAEARECARTIAGWLG